MKEMCTEFPEFNNVMDDFTQSSIFEQSLWKLLDFAELKQSSISFFNLEKQKTAFSRWSRARTRAAKVYQKQQSTEACFATLA